MRKQARHFNRLRMCGEFYKFGIASALIGLFFFAAGFILSFSPLRVSICVFFLALAVLDLALYVKHGEG